MMLELIESGIALFSTGVGTCIGFGIRNLKTPKPNMCFPVVSNGIMEWAWDADSKSFICPKCQARLEVSGVRKCMEHPTICSCEEYHQEHFHICCADCKYSVIMKTADDK